MFFSLICRVSIVVLAMHSTCVLAAHPGAMDPDALYKAAKAKDRAKEYDVAFKLFKEAYENNFI